MARTPLTVTPLAHSGIPVTLIAADNVNGNSFTNDGQTVLVVRSPAAGGTVTIRVNYIVDQTLIVPDRPVVIAASTTFLLGPFSTSVYTQVDGLTYIDFSVAGFTVLLVSVVAT